MSEAVQKSFFENNVYDKKMFQHCLQMHLISNFVEWQSRKFIIKNQKIAIYSFICQLIQITRPPGLPLRVSHIPAQLNIHVRTCVRAHNAGGCVHAS